MELIGPKVVSLIGGASGTYVKTKGSAGAGKLTIKALGKTYTVNFEVRVEENDIGTADTQKMD